MSTATRRALYGTMSGDTTLRSMLGTPPSGYGQSIYYQSAPNTAQYPLVIFSKQSGVPSEAFHDPTAIDTEIWLVKGVDHDSSANDVEAIAERVRVLLNDGTLSIAGNTELYLRRNSDVDYEELVAGETYKHSGSLYRLVIEHT